MQDGTLNREKLGDIIFSDVESRKKLNLITHPEIIKEMVFSAIKLGFQGSKNFIFFFFVFFREFVPREKGFDNCTPPDFRSCVRRPRYTPVIRNGRISQVNAQNNSRLLFGKHSDRAAGDEKSFDGGIGQIENRLSNASGGKMRKGRLRHRQFIYAGRDESAS